MAKVISELASTPTQFQVYSSSKKQTAKKIKKEPDVYIFRLCKEHPKMYEGASVFPPVFVIPNRDTILYNYGTTEEPNIMPRQIRYISGHKSIFVDEQEEKGSIAENIISSPQNSITFQTGHLNVPSWNKQLYDFLMLSNQCEQNTNKMKQVKNVYRLIDFGGNDDDIVELGKKKDRAYDIARNCTNEEMIPHAKFLGIQFNHPSTGEERDYDVIRENYKAKALENPDQFLKYANNPRVKVLYIIDKALDSNVITTEIIRGQLHWTSTKQLITLIGVDKTPSEAITDYALSDEGESFLRTLKTQM